MRKSSPSYPKSVSLSNKSSVGWTGPPRGELEALPLALKVEGRSGHIVPQGNKGDYEMVYVGNSKPGEENLARLLRSSDAPIVVCVVERNSEDADGLAIWRKLLSCKRSITILLLPGKVDAEPYMKETRGQWKGQASTTQASATSRAAME